MNLKELKVELSENELNAVVGGMGKKRFHYLDAVAPLLALRYSTKPTKVSKSNFTKVSKSNFNISEKVADIFKKVC